MKEVINATPQPLYPVPTVQEPGCTPWTVWTGAENLAPPGFDPGTVQRVASRNVDCAVWA